MIEISQSNCESDSKYARREKYTYKDDDHLSSSKIWNWTMESVKPMIERAPCSRAEQHGRQKRFDEKMGGMYRVWGTFS